MNDFVLDSTSLGHAGVGLRFIHLSVFHLDEIPGIQPLTGDAQRQELIRQDGRGEQLSETLNRVQARRTQFTQQIDTICNALQGLEEFVHGSGRPLPVPFSSWWL